MMNPNPYHPYTIEHRIFEQATLCTQLGHLAALVGATWELTIQGISKMVADGTIINVNGRWWQSTKYKSEGAKP